mgnify:FL=1
MKLRTSLAAAATATAVMVSGAAVADAAPTVNDTAESKSKDNNTDSDKKTIKDSLSSSNEEGSSIEDMSPEELKSWIAVVTAIIGMLTQVLSVASKFAR